ncbi:MAG: hypothetical protein KF687_17965 [Cyclobacteriaceae bacterium]|nr:hypothetical protein [Cyclobacteriaceae bacterium]
MTFILFIWILFEQKNDWLLHELQAYVNEAQSGHLEISQMELNVLGSFPSLEVALKEIRYYQSRNDSLLQSPVLSADQIAVSLDIIPLLREQIRISEITVSQTRIRLTSDSLGQLNLVQALASPQKKIQKVQAPVSKKDQPKKTGKPKSEPVPAASPHAVQFDLQLLDVNNLEFVWLPYDSDSTVVFIQHITVDLTRTQDLVSVKLYSKQELTQIVLRNNSFDAGRGTFTANASYDLKSRALTISESVLKQSGVRLVVQGECDFKRDSLRLTVDAAVTELEFLESIIRPDIVKQNPDLLKHGQIFLRGKVFGPVDHPQTELDFGVKDLSWKVPGKPISFEKIGFSGQFISGSNPNLSQAKLILRDLRGQVPGGSIRGYFSMVDFVNPYVQYDLNLKTNLEGYDEIFNLTYISELKGKISAQAEYSGLLRTLADASQDSSRSSELELNDLSFRVTKTGLTVSGLNALILTEKSKTRIQPISFQYGENQLQADLEFNQNLFTYLLDRKSGIEVTGHVRAPILYTNDIIPDSLQQAQVQDEVRDLKFTFEAALTPVLNRKGESPILDLNITNMSAQLKELPDIKHLEFKSTWNLTQEGLYLKLSNIKAKFPLGEVNASGNLHVPTRNRWNFDVDIKVKQFPWIYIRELSAELQTDLEPSRKNHPTNEMDWVTANGHVSSSIITYPFNIEHVQLKLDRVVYQAPNAKPVRADAIELKLSPLHFKHPENSGILIGLQSLTGDATIKKLTIPGLTFRNLKTQLRGQQDTLQIEFECVTQKSKREHGVLQLYLGEQQGLSYQLNYDVSQADLGTYLKEQTSKKLLSGLINYQLQLSTTGKDWMALKQNMKGTIAISGKALVMYGVDIDKALKKYEKSQNFNLTDVGALLVAGPIGLAVTKGSNFISLAAITLDTTQHTRIDTLYARWNLDQLQLRTEDVAFTTPLNRIAIQGHVDLLHQEVPGILIAVVDKEGCSLMDQEFSGKFSALNTGKLNITKTLLGSVINFVNAVAGVNCKPVYSGHVKHPN